MTLSEDSRKHSLNKTPKAQTMIDKFEYIKIKTFHSIFLQVENELQLLYLKSQASMGVEEGTGKRQAQEFHRKGTTNVHKHEKVVSFISDQGNANKSQVTILHPLE